jgi:hypothetical protein
VLIGPYVDFHHSGRLTKPMLDPYVLYVHPGVPNVGEQPAQLPRPVRDHHLHCCELYPFGTVLAGEPTATRHAASKHIAEFGVI